MTERVPERRTNAVPGKTLTAIVVFALLAYGLSWAVWIPAIPGDTSSISNAGFGTALIVGSFGPTVAALVVTTAFAGRAGLVVLARRLVRIRARWWVWLLALFALPVVFTGVDLASGVGVAQGEDVGLVLLTTTVAVPVNALIGGVLLGPGPLGEETGWRGFLTPAVLRRLPTDAVSAVVVGVVWAFWHLPLFAFDDWRGGLSTGVFTAVYPIGASLVSYCMIKLMRWSRGSIAVAIMFHGVVNTAIANATSTSLWEGVGGPGTQLLIQLSGLGLTAAVFAVVARTRAALRITTGPADWAASPERVADPSRQQETSRR